MLNSLLEHLLYPKAIVLILTGILVFVWAGYFCTSMNRQYGSKSIKSYSYYISYTFGLFVWIMSNAYFHTGYLVEFGEHSAKIMALVANLSALLAFSSAYFFTVKLKTHYTQTKPFFIQSFISNATILLCLTWNLLPDLTIKGVSIDGPSQFVLDFGEYTKPFFLGLTVLVVLSFINLFSIRGSASRIRRTRINYMILGMTIFMCSTAVIQLGFTYVFNDFSLTWLPPALSISEMIFMGYAILASRFYSLRHMCAVSLTVTLTATVYTGLILLLDRYFVVTTMSILATSMFVGVTWPLCFKRLKVLVNYVLYGNALSPTDKIARLESQFQYSPTAAMDTLAQYLGVPSDKLKLLDDYQGASKFRSYFETNSTPLVLDELEDKLEQSTTEELSELHSSMHQTQSALVLPIYESKNKLSHVLVSSHKLAGVTFSYEELKALERVLKKVQVHINYNQKLRQAQALANSIAHEMRNPLAQVQLEFESLSENLANSAPYHQLSQHVVKGKHAITRGRQLIDIILREVNSSSLELEPVEPISMRTTIQNAVTLYGFDKESDAQRVHVHLEHDFVANINETLFNFVMFNLLRNAVYYFDSFPESTVEIRTEADEFENKIIVRDTGPGIPEALLARIFDDFFSHNKSGGSGLGLGYCKRVMKSFGGSIRCFSQEGHYTEFVLAFPISNISLANVQREQIETPASPVQPVVTSSSKQAPVSKNQMILVVDDKEVQRALVKLYLEQLGYGVVLANNGKVAIEIIQNNPIDLIFMDIQMPVMDGFEAAEIIKKSFPAIPIIALSGEAAEEDLAKIGELMDGRLSKPATKDALNSTLESVFSAESVV